MALWIGSLVALILGIRFISPKEWRISSLSGRHEQRMLFLVESRLHEFQDCLEAGLVPESSRWSALETLPPPWGTLVSRSLLELRQQGGALLPTLRRLRELAKEHQVALRAGRARTSQSLAQAVVCGLLVPTFGSALYFLLPGLAERGWIWGSACGLATLLAVIAALWLLDMAENARWGGLSERHRPWILAAQSAGERFLALLRSGYPADLAWAKACDLVSGEAPGLAVRWGCSFWEEQPTGPAAEGLESVLIATGGALRKAVHVSLMEGKPCGERVEGVLQSLGQDSRVLVERELGLLPTRALKPLFLLIAPSLFGLLGFGLYLGWLDAMGGP